MKLHISKELALPRDTVTSTIAVFGGGSFGNPIGALRSKGFLDYRHPGFVKAADWIFL